MYASTLFNFGDSLLMNYAQFYGIKIPNVLAVINFEL